MNHRINQLYSEMEANAGSLCNSLSSSRKRLFDILHGRVPLPANCPSRTALVESMLWAIDKRLGELASLRQELRETVYEETMA